MTRYIIFVVLILSNLGLGYILHQGIGDLPPMGRVLNPFQGLWRNGPEHLSDLQKITGLKSKVEVVWDDHGVPHVFAQNEDDLFFMQGYLHARHRLWQMDVQTRAGQARVSEMVGSKAREFDEFVAQIGLREASVKARDEILSNESTAAVVKAYLRGVNSYIKNLTYRQLPVEYKLLNTWPEEFTELRVAAFLKIMSLRLAGRSYDLELTRLLKKFGAEKVRDLFPLFPEGNEPIIYPEELKTLAGKKANFNDHNFVSQFADYPKILNGFAYLGKGEGFNGSNNWAVGKSRSQSGHILVANDTHLNYSLPSIWYEMHLVAPGINVYGASFPGTPSIIVGFNSKVSWAVTNAAPDVMDFFEVKFRNDFSEYLYESEWKKAERVQHVIKSKNSQSFSIENVWTHHGVKVAEKNQAGLVLAWTVHQPSN